jgi:hypothetical protein
MQVLDCFSFQAGLDGLREDDKGEGSIVRKAWFQPWWHRGADSPVRPTEADQNARFSAPS